MNGQIFISYRREDGSAWAGRLYDRLKSRFASEKIFMDVDSLAPGVDFVEALERSVGGCDVLIAVIGRRWLSASDEEGNRRLDNPEDFVRVEVATALQRGIRVIPVLVEGAPVPRSRELPEDLKALVRRNALEVSHNRFSADSERLISAVEEVLEGARVEQQRKREEQGRVEAEQREREERERLEAQRRQKEAQDRLEAERRQREAQERLQAEHREKERLEAQRREREGKGQREAKRPETEALGGISADSRAPLSSQTPLKGITANLKKPRRLLFVIAIGMAACLLGLGLFKATRPPPVSIGGSSSPTPAPVTAQSNLPSPTPSASQTSPSPTPSGADWLAEAKRYLGANDYAQALPLLQKAAGAGDAEAMNNLGELYYYGGGIAQDFAQARQWYQRAADGGNVAAMANLGVLYQNGQGVAQDYAQARQWYQKAADKGDAAAKQRLEWLQHPNPGVVASSPSPVSEASASPMPPQTDWLAEARGYVDARQYARAQPLLERAASAGDGQAMYDLGHMYENGLAAGGYDFPQARVWYRKAAEAGGEQAMYRLGYLYDHGQGGGRDFIQALNWYRKAAKAGNVSAMYGLGVLYESGQGVSQDYVQARRWYQKASDAGNADAKEALARLPSNPSPTPSGADWFAEAKRYLSSLYANDYAKALPLLRKAANAGNAEAMNQLGELYLWGLGVHQDYAQARQWYQKAADAGSAEAMIGLGQLYEFGWGVDRDRAQADQWYQKAAEAKKALAQLPSK